MALITYPISTQVEHAHAADSHESAGGAAVTTYILYAVCAISITMAALIPGVFLALVLFLPAILPILFWALVASAAEQISHAK